ncbi:MAG: ATP-dependent DNA helicase [Clostridia bacterium]|nr:ATP-dependent DNA helicase [Clostridia bacterium]
MNAAPLRTSVRHMAEFSMRSGDLLPISSSAMLEGSRAHRARQKNADAVAERPVKWQGECCGIQAVIQGRVDLLWEHIDPICVDELKLCSEEGLPPQAAVPVHRMQAICYGFMLCEELDLKEISVRVSYVTQDGLVRASFEERLTRAEAEAQFFSVLQPLAQWHAMQEAYIVQRNASLHALSFPYAIYRPGQREMAAQVYTAIDRRKRLFATLPTGTGKSAATLFPALKALAEGKTRQVFYLTARGTTRLAALDALARMREQPLTLRVVLITAKEKCCPFPGTRCHPDDCPRAKGYYDRELPALMDACALNCWDEETARSLCEKHALCPFEFSLALCEISDVVICDYNYVFDPLISLNRIIGAGMPVTLLMDEAHNLPSRVRDMLSATLDSRALAALRRETGKLHGRKHPLYQAMTALHRSIKDLGADSLSVLSAATDKLIGVMSLHAALPQAEGFHDFFRDLLQCRMALERFGNQPEDYTVLIDGAAQKRVTLLCLNISDHLRQITRHMMGCVFFSATLEPLPEMKKLLGGDEGDAVFALPSPFPSKRLLVLSLSVNTRYQHRQESAREIAEAILALYNGKAGKYIAFFPSYAYLLMILENLTELQPDLALNVQERSMSEESRDAFLRRMRDESGALLSLCVLGGIFAEGIDLPGDQLIGAAVVGVGLPQVNETQEALRAHYAQTLGDGFAFAYRYPGMQKVLQAAGRVIRSEKDAGVILLLDSRYRESAYVRLLPPHYHLHPMANADEIRRCTQDFWNLYGN